MCGRYAFFSPSEAVKRVFALDDVPELEPRYNIAPTQDVAAVRTGEEGARAFAMLHWGLVPAWSKERAIEPHDQRARRRWRRSRRSARHSEAPLPRARRRLVRMAGRGRRQAALVHPQEGRAAFCIRGLWERWKIRPTARCSSLHDRHDGRGRSIRKIQSECRSCWKRPTGTAGRTRPFRTRTLSELLKPCDPKTLEAWPVSREVNAPKNQGPG
jgi:putative SOS response-associated peptidase YedK